MSILARAQEKRLRPPCRAGELTRKIERMNAKPIQRGQRLPHGFRILVFAGVCALASPGKNALCEIPVETIERPGGARLTGRLAGDLASGFSFTPAQAVAPFPVEPGSTIELSGPGPNSLERPPAFRVLIGESLRLSGSLRGISPTAVRLGVRWQGAEITIPRPGVQAVIQRPGEACVLADGFETIEGSRWKVTGKPEVTAEPHLADKRSLRLPAGGAGAAVFTRLSEPLPTGRFEVAFFDDGAVVAGQQWWIELTFQGASGASVIRVSLGWAEESLAVESPSGPALAVQRLARTPGWHRLSIRFAADQTEVSVDGKELAHGKAPDGPLVAIRLSSSATAQADAPKGLACHLDDLQLIRFAEPPVSLEFDVTHDEARLVVGDQMYGTLTRTDSERVNINVDGDPVSLPWSDVAGLYFRRLPAEGASVKGLLTRLEWRCAAGDDADIIDFAEGALTAVSDQIFTLATPYSGVLSIPRERVKRLVVQGEGRRIVIDPAAHHLGDEFSSSPPLLDPPQPEGSVLERTLTLAEVPQDPCFLVLDVVQVVGLDNDPQWSARVRDGELRTYIAVNGKRIDFLNRYVKRNDAPERVAIPVPANVLRVGRNTFRLELTRMATKDQELDDFGVLQMALEFRATPMSNSGRKSLHAPNPP